MSNATCRPGQHAYETIRRKRQPSTSSIKQVCRSKLQPNIICMVLPRLTTANDIIICRVETQRCLRERPL